MAVYVDPWMEWSIVPGWKYGGVSHLHTTPDADLDELHRFAQSIGLKQSWFQDSTTIPHYDLSPNKRLQAIRAGAVEITQVKMGKHIQLWRNKRKKEKHGRS